MLELFNVLVENCKVASCFFLALMLVRPLTEKFFSQSWHYLAFRVNLLLFFLPIGWLSEEIAPLLVKLFPMVATQEEVARQVDFVPYLNDLIKEPAPPTFTQANPIDWTGLLVSAWFCVGGCIFLWQMYCILRFRKEVNGLSAIQCPVIQKFFIQCKEWMGFTGAIPLLGSENIYSPVLLGLQQPKILLPIKKVQEKHLEYIFTHELTHLRRKDLWWKALLTPLTILYWWNPLVYLFSWQFETVLEYSCDEEVVKLRSHEERKCYGKAILESIDEEQTNPVLGLHLRKPEQILETRLIKMLKFNEMKTKTKVLSGVLMSAMLLGAAAPVVANSVENVSKISNTADNATMVSYTEYSVKESFSSESVATYPDLSGLKLRHINLGDTQPHAGNPDFPLYVLELWLEGDLSGVNVHDFNSPIRKMLLSPVVVTFSDGTTQELVPTDCSMNQGTKNDVFSSTIPVYLNRLDVESISYLGTDFTLPKKGKTYSYPASVNTWDEESFTARFLTLTPENEEFCTPEEWNILLEKVELGEILWFDSSEEEQTYWNNYYNEHPEFLIPDTIEINTFILVEDDKIDEFLFSLTSVNATDEESFAPNVWARILEKVESGEVLFFETRAEEQEWLQNNTINLLEEGKREWEAVEVHEILSIAPEDESNFTPEEWADILKQVEDGEILMMEASTPMLASDGDGIDLVLVDKIPFDGSETGEDVASTEAAIVMFSVNKEDENRYSPEVWAEFMEKVEAGEMLLFDTIEEEQEYMAHLWDTVFREN